MLLISLSKPKPNKCITLILITVGSASVSRELVNTSQIEPNSGGGWPWVTSADATASLGPQLYHQDVQNISRYSA